MLFSPARNLQSERAKSLLQLTLERGGSDNVSIALAMREEADAHAEF